MNSLWPPCERDSGGPQSLARGQLEDDYRQSLGGIRGKMSSHEEMLMAGFAEGRGGSSS